MTIDADAQDASPVTLAAARAEFDADVTYPNTASDVRRFDVSPAWHAWVAAAPAVRLLAQVGTMSLHRHALGLANHRGVLRQPPRGRLCRARHWPGAAASSARGYFTELLLIGWSVGA